MPPKKSRQPIPPSSIESKLCPVCNKVLNIEAFHGHWNADSTKYIRATKCRDCAKGKTASEKRTRESNTHLLKTMVINLQDQVNQQRLDIDDLKMKLAKSIQALRAEFSRSQHDDQPLGSQGTQKSEPLRSPVETTKRSPNRQ